MYHSITFGSKNTWEDWHLVPSSRPVFSPPALKKKTLDIPGGDGLIDLSDSLTGYSVYNNREGSFEFIVMNDYWEWQEAYSTIMDYLHGIKMTAFLEDDPDYYYEGRFTVSDWKSDKNYSLIVIDYDVAPYKRKFEESVKNIQVTTTKQLYTFNTDFYGREPVCPVFHVETSGEQGMTIGFVNDNLNISATKQVSDGKIQIPEFVFYGNSVKIYFQVDDTEMYLEDSNGNQMLDSSGNKIQTKANGNVSVSCKYGRL